MDREVASHVKTCAPRDIKFITAMKMRAKFLRAIPHPQGFQEWALCAQTLIALFMLISLWQTHQSVELTRKQLDLSIAPVLDSRGIRGGMELKNISSIPILNLEMVANLNGKLDKFGNLTAPILSTVHRSLISELKPGDIYHLPYQDFIRQPLVQLELNQPDLYCVILRFRRAGDLKPYYKFVYFAHVRTVNTDNKQEEYIYFPLSLLEGGGMDEEIPMSFFHDLREQMQKYLVEQIDLPGLD